VAVVPSLAWLLEPLTGRGQGSAAATGVVAVGGVDYGPAAGKAFYPSLAGTGREMARVLEVFGAPAAQGLSGAAATVEVVRARVPGARVAHFATHGFFNSSELA